MIKEISIENFILIDSQTIKLSNGLNVLTGETGHGKSILLKAIMLLFQGNISKKFIRSEDKTSKVKGIIDVSSINNIPELLKKKYSIHNDITIIRTFNNKKSSISINNIDSSLQELEELGQYLCQALTQFQKFELLKPESQLVFCDSLLPSRLNKTKYENHYRIYSEIQKEIIQLNKELEKSSYTIDYKKEEFEKLSSLEINNSDLYLEEKIAKLENFDKEKDKLNSLFSLFNNEESGLQQSFQSFKKTIVKSSLFDKLENNLSTIQNELNEIENTLLEEIDLLDNSHENLEEILSRYNQLKPVLKKHNNSIANLFLYENNLKETINRHEKIITLIDELSLQLKKEELNLINTGKDLSKERQKVAKSIESSVLSNFKELNLVDSVLKIDIQESAIKETGINDINFLIKTNKGGNFYPLEEVISGGELSRIMFTLINIQKNKGSILCFDEIDAGIGGKTSIQLSKKIKEISDSHQIICITHSPSIAVIANNHIFVSKTHKENSTITNFDSLDNNLILNEIARMLGYDSNKEGQELTETIIKELIHQIER